MVYGTVLKFLLDVGYDETSNPGAHVSPSFRSEIVDINNGILKTRDPECQIVFCIKKFKNRFSGFFTWVICKELLQAISNATALISFISLHMDGAGSRVGGFKVGLEKIRTDFKNVKATR